MSTVVSKNVQIGADGTASNNFTAYQPSTPDGTLRIGNGNSGSVTDAIVLNSSGNVGIGTSSPSNRLSVVTASGSDGFISISSPTSDTAGVSVNGGTDYNKGAIVRFQKNATTKWTMGTDSAIIGATSDNFHLYGGGANSILFSTNASERLRIDSSGNIGIGTSSPINNGGYGGLTLNGTNGALFSMMTNGTESSRIASLGDETSIQCKASTGYISFVQGVSGGTEQMRLTSTGLGIGTSSPGSKLHVVSSGNTPIQAQSSGGTSAYIQMTNTGGGGFISTTNNDLVFSTTGSAIERLRLDSSGNLGLGVTPSASTTAQFQIGRGVVNAVSNYTTLGDNATFDGSWKYIASTGASLYQQNTGAHAWYTAPSGTAGNAISFTQAMTLTSGGNLYLGTTTGLASSVGAGLYIQSSSYVPAGQVTELLGHWMANANDNNGTGGVGIKYYRVPRGGGVQSGTEIRFYTGYTYTPPTTAEVARFDQSGNLLVGTTIAAGKLAVNGKIRVLTGDFELDSGQLTTNSSANPLRLGVDGVEKARITSSGNLLVGTTSSTASTGETAKLQVAGGIRATSGLLSSISLGNIAQNATTTASVGVNGLWVLSNGGGNFALFNITLGGGGAGTIVIFSTGGGPDIVGGSTSEPSGGGYLRLWISGGVLQVKNINAYTGPWYLTPIATFII